MHHYTLKIIAFLILTLGIANEPVTSDENTGADDDTSLPSIDIPQILARKKLVALTGNSSTSYFIYKGEPMGYEYEMLKSFSKYLQVDLQIVVVNDINQVFDLLRKGEVDIVSANLTITEERMKKVNFTEPLIYTRQVLVQQKPKGWRTMTADEIDKSLVRSTIDLSGKDIYVRKESSFHARLVNLQDEIASRLNIIEAPSEISTEGLITMVANGRIPYTVADENVAMVNQTYYPDIDIKTPVSFPQKIGWAVSKKSPLLLAELNKWISDKKNKDDYAILYNKYFKNPKGAEKRNASEFSSMGGNKISPYDDLIREYSTVIDWDWRLLASMIYQESKFDPDAQSWAGACGLMQMVPSTALQYGVDTCGATPVESIYAGTRHISRLDEFWAKFITAKEERIKFVLASYNVGLGHIIDARRLAVKFHKNENVWFDNVEKFILLKSYPKYYNDPVVRCGYCRGEEPYKYVREIIARQEHYKNIIDQEEEMPEFFAKIR